MTDEPLWPPPPRPGAAVRVPICTPRFSPMKFVKTAFGLGAATVQSTFERRLRRVRQTGDVSALSDFDAMSFAPLTVRDSGAAWVFDDVGMRLEGYRKLRAAQTWDEIDRVVLEVQKSSGLGLQALRAAIWPTDARAFASAHPECAVLWDDLLGTCSLVLGKGPSIPQDTIDLALVGLRFAGSRFEGQLVTSHTG